jgi:hypothetical protein
MTSLTRGFISYDAAVFMASSIPAAVSSLPVSIILADPQAIAN